MRVCDRCHKPGELAMALPDAMTNPVELCARCTSDFFEWVTSGVRRASRDAARASRANARAYREAVSQAPEGMFAETQDFPPMNDWPVPAEAAE